MQMPSLFIAHAAPSIAIEHDDYTRALRKAGQSLRGARAIVLASAHWQTRNTTRVNGMPQPPLIYDFGGFSDELYSVRYDAPGDPELAREVASMLDAPLELARGWDHGVWTPLIHLVPDASIPIVEISLPFPAEPQQLLDIGRKLAPLRDRGIVIAGSGGIVHNLSLIKLTDKHVPADSWAIEFDEWIATRVRDRDFESLTRYRQLAPHAARAVPTPEHFEPLFIACGASHDDDALHEIHAGM